MFYLIKYYFYKVRNWLIPSYKLRIEYSNSRLPIIRNSGNSRLPIIMDSDNPTYKSDRIYLMYDDVLLNDS